VSGKADTILLQPIGWVRGGRETAIDDDWGSVEATIVLDGRFPADALVGLDSFSHVEVVFVFDQVDESKIHVGARRPRNNGRWPEVGIFAQRARARPNRIGLTTCEVVGLDGHELRVRGLDAIDGSPILDLKPYFVEFAPRVAVRQPSWATELMARYW
jgi:tRNA-Thr(GGU) m(6)t(6)A37 methyltransferase TsaA